MSSLVSSINHSGDSVLNPSLAHNLARMSDLTYGGQHGWASNLQEYLGNQAYVRKQLYCVVLEVPSFFRLMSDPDKWTQIFKSLMETQSRSIEGLKADITVDTDEHAVGGAGEMMQEPIDSKRARSEPSHTFVERIGMPIQNFISQWIDYGIINPDTKVALASTLPGARVNINEWLAERYSATCLYFEADATFTKVTKAWICTNMYPKGTGSIEGKRDLTTGGEINTLTIEFTALSLSNTLGVKLFAQNILNQINITNANPNLRPSFVQGIHPDLYKARNGGLVNSIANVGANAIV